MERDKRIPSQKHLWLVGLSLLFFFLPTVNIVDPIPDVIGYLILLAGLRSLADLHEDIEASRRLFSYMVGVDLAKLLSLMWLFGAMTGNERDSAILLLSFVFSVVELIVLIPAYRRLFAGLVNLGYRFPNTSLLGKDGQKAPADKVRRSTMVFLAVKASMTVLPEMSNLSTHSAEDGASALSLYRYIGLMRGMAGTVTLIFGVIWLCRMWRFWARLRRDTDFLDAIAHEYEAVILPQTGRFALRAMKQGTMLICLGALLLIDFRMDGFLMIPDALGYILMLCGAYVMRPHLHKSVSRFRSAAALAVVLSLASYLSDVLYYEQYSYNDALRNEQVLRSYIVVIVLSLVSTFGFALVVLALRSLYCEIISLHTGAMIEIDSEQSHARWDRFRVELKRSTVWLFVGGAVALVTDVLRTVWENEYGVMGFVGLAGGLVFALTVFKVTSELMESVQTRYTL